MFGKNDPVSETYPQLRALKPEDVQQIAFSAIEAAIDYTARQLQGEREKADRYYRGETDIPATPGRSQIVVSKVRDTVKSVIPSLARVFTQTDDIGEFWSDYEEDQLICSQATKYCNNVYGKYGGYTALIEAMTDSLKAKIGVMEVYAEKVDVPVHTVYTMPPPTDNNVIPMMQGQPTESDGKETVITKLRKKVKWSLVAIPPEEFFINSNAICVDDAYVCGRRENKTVSEMVSAGFDFDKVKDLDNYSYNAENTERHGDNFTDIDDHDTGSIDPSARVIGITTAFIRIDADGDGIAELRRLVLGGTGYELLADEPANFAPYAIFKSDLQPHVLHPICLAEDTIQDQDAQTAIMRGIIDNVALVNSPRTEANETMVNLEDLMNGQIGSIVRVRQMGQINELTTPFVAGQTLPVLEYLNTITEQRTGVTRMSQGIDPDALQSTTHVAAQAAVQGSDARVEMMARNLAETGVTSMMMCILKTAIYIIKDKQSISLPDGFYQVDPTMWHDQLNIRSNVGLGSGQIDEKKQTLAQLLPMQMQIMEKFGYSNTVCGWAQVRESLKTILRLSGIRDYDKYFPFIPPDQIKAFDQQAQQQSQQAQQAQQSMQQQALQAQVDSQKAMVQMVQVEAQKAQLKYQTDMAETNRKYQGQIQDLRMQLATVTAKTQVDKTQMVMKDDLERDKALLDFTVNVAKVQATKQQLDASLEAQAAKDIEGGSGVPD